MRRRIRTNALVILMGTIAPIWAAVAQETDAAAKGRAVRADESPDAGQMAVAAESHVASVDAAPPAEISDWNPPLRGAPRVRKSPGVRAGRALPVPVALRPDFLAQNANPAPSLFWFIDEVPPAHVKIVFTLIHRDAMEPLIETELARVRQAGIQRIRLAEFGVRLDSDAEYEWSVTLVPDSDRRSRDLITIGYIRRVEPPAELQSELRVASVDTYASLGLWYDALEVAIDASDAAPTDSELRRLRDALLSQAGLDSVPE